MQPLVLVAHGCVHLCLCKRVWKVPSLSIRVPARECMIQSVLSLTRRYSAACARVGVLMCMRKPPLMCMCRCVCVDVYVLPTLDVYVSPTPPLTPLI